MLYRFKLRLLFTWVLYGIYFSDPIHDGERTMLISSPSKIDRAYQSTMSVRLSVCLSVCPSPPLTLFKLNISIRNFLHFFLKPNQELSSKMGKNGQNFIHVMGTSSKPKLGLWGKKIILSEWPEILYTCIFADSKWFLKKL